MQRLWCKRPNAESYELMYQMGYELSTRWVPHMINALENLLNGLKAHIHSYTTISLESDYSATQKSKAKFFAKKLVDQHLMSTAIYILDVCRAMTIFSEALVSTKKKCFNV
nr:uncharacterized protein LOC124808412 [Hydra vulgaris]